MMSRSRDILTPEGRRGRNDGNATKVQLLDAAGQIFAERGFDGATAKAIADKAGSNAASINYHFGGITGLYEHVLAEAHRRLLSYRSLSTIFSAQQGPEAKLRSLIGAIVAALAGPASTSWALRVICREFISPTAHLDVMRVKELTSKLQLIRSVVAEHLGRQPGDPLVQRAVYSMLAPCLMLVIGRDRISSVVPALALTEDQVPDITAYLSQMALLTLSGVRRMADQRPPAEDDALLDRRSETVSGATR